VNLLSVERLSKSHGGKDLFTDISFGINKGEKAALIARNGTGKSTLLNILAGREVPDSGKVTMRNDIRWAYLEQDPAFDESKTILQHLFEAGSGNLHLISRYEALLEEQALHPNDPKILHDIQHLAALIETHRAWDAEAQVRQILGRLDIHDLHRKISELSGGQRKRITLAKALIGEPDLLLMDEPTNHLDVDMIEWLEDYFLKSSCGLLLVTHDRYFLDDVCDKILELDSGKLYTYEGNYSYFLEKKDERETAEASELSKTKNIFRKELEWIRRMPRARGTKSKARVGSFEVLKKEVKGKRKEEELQLDVKMNRIGGKVLEMKKVYKSFGDFPILKGFDYTFKTGERIGIVGRNGTGKTTFLNLITGLEKADTGKINVGDTIVFGYYSQQGLPLKEDKRVIEVVKDYADVIPLADGSKVTASSFLQLFQFPPEIQHTYVSKLSGGEKRRLHLLTVLMKNPNFLILDEPTNDLDLLTLSTLEDFLAGFRGCLLVVSHDRYFMDKLVDHLFVFEGNGEVLDSNGTYTEYRAQKELKEKAKSKSEKQQREKDIAAAALQPEPTDKKKATFKERFEFETLEKEINALEKEKSELSEKLNSGQGAHQELLEWAYRIEEVMKLLDKKTGRWLELSEIM